MSMDEVRIKEEPHEDVTEYHSNNQSLSPPDLPASENKLVNIKVEVDTSKRNEPELFNPKVSKSDPIEDINIFQPVVIIKEEIIEECNDVEVESPSWHRQSPAMILPHSVDEINDTRIPNITSDANFKCPVCHKEFSSKGNVQRHLEHLHLAPTYKCDICSKIYKKEDHYKKHVLTHSEKREYVCPECGKKFKSTSNLEQHKKTHLKIKPFSCDNCERQFTFRAQYQKHNSKKCSKPNTAPLVCNVCNKVFLKKFLLKSHLRRHVTEKPFSCEKCNINFKHKSTLTRHILLHDGEKPFACDVCGKGFAHPGLIKPHMRKHTGEKPFECPICKKMFAHKHNMERHQIRHAKVKNLVCSVCNKKFPKESRLKYHMRTHTKEKPFSCYVCNKNFSHKQNVLRHFDRKHPNDNYEDFRNITVFIKIEKDSDDEFEDKKES